jgi:hypothetical protein
MMRGGRKLNACDDATRRVALDANRRSGDTEPALGAVIGYLARCATLC